MHSWRLPVIGFEFLIIWVICLVLFLLIQLVEKLKAMQILLCLWAQKQVLASLNYFLRHMFSKWLFKFLSLVRITEIVINAKIQIPEAFLLVRDLVCSNAQLPIWICPLKATFKRFSTGIEITMRNLFVNLNTIDVLMNELRGFRDINVAGIQILI